jgi:hypothetical protein
MSEHNPTDGIYTSQDVANGYQKGYRDCIREANRRAGYDLWLAAVNSDTKHQERQHIMMTDLAPVFASMAEYYRWFYGPDPVPGDTHKADIALLAWLHEEKVYEDLPLVLKNVLDQTPKPRLPLQ